MEKCTEPPLAIENLRCGYGMGDVLAGVSLSVGRGEIVGLAGRNGAGKTTLLMAVLGRVALKHGSVRVCGINSGHLPPRKLARLAALAPQLVDVPFSFTVDEFVSLGRLPHVGRLSAPGPADLAAVDRAIDRTGLAGLRRRQLDTLSGGERQRAVVAQAIAQEPVLLMLDEPASHLDIAHQITVFEILQEVAAAGAGVIVVLHDLNIASEYCNRVALLDEGRVLADGEPSTVVTPGNIEKAFGIRLKVETPADGSAPFVRCRREPA